MARAVALDQVGFGGEAPVGEALVEDEVRVFDRDDAGLFAALVDVVEVAVSEDQLVLPEEATA